MLCLAVDGQTPGIIGAAIDKRNGRMAEDYFEGGQLCKSVAGPNSAIVGFGDGVMKVSHRVTRKGRTNDLIVVRCL